jgi:HCOMODA/2-hydroxy-3-carboxy-muconic semialdehyde decarboxylase
MEVLVDLNKELVDRLVIANHILYDQGVVDGLGHISVRNDLDPHSFLLSCNRAPALVSDKDIVCYDLDGNSISVNPERPYLERFIHSEIYRSRPDVIAVVHHHSASVIPFGITNITLKPVYHMAGFLGKGSAFFEIRNSDPESDMLIRDVYLGEALAKSLGKNNCVLMRGHGATVVGNSIEQVVYRAIYTEMNAKLQMQAMNMGEVTYLNNIEADKASAANDGQILRSWNLWKKKVEG